MAGRTRTEVSPVRRRTGTGRGRSRARALALPLALVLLLGVVVLGGAPAALGEPSPAPASSSQLVTVDTASPGATTGTLTAWQRDAGGDWHVALGPVPAFVGAGGVGAASESSTRTPAGTFPLTESFGRAANPGTAMPWFTSDRSDWWNSNTASPTYNTHVRQAADPGGSSENLYDAGAVYDYAVNIGYNLARTPGAGSAIFLHVSNGSPTAGCVSTDRSTVVDVLRWLDPARSPAIDIRTGTPWTPPPAQAPGNPTGSLDGAGLVGTTYSVRGWAVDPDVPAQPLSVDVYDRRPDGSVGGTRTTADGPRPDVAAAVPGAGAAHGFDLALRLPGPGPHQVCVYAINVGRGTGNPLLGCRDVDVPGATGSLDAVTNPAPGVLSTRGWAADPDAPGAQEQVHLYVSGSAGTAGTAGVLTGGSRPDVAAALPWAGSTTGFAASVGTQGAGTTTVCAYAISVDLPRTNPSVGCRTLDVRDTFGALDSVTVAAGSVTLTGWALNPNTPGEQVGVHVYDLGPAGTTGHAGYRADLARPDVGVVHPGYPGPHGYQVVLPVSTPGAHTLCAYAITTGGGAGNSLLGCRQVTIV